MGAGRGVWGGLVLTLFLAVACGAASAQSGPCDYDTAAVWVYTCTGTRGVASELGGQERPTCDPPETGNWVEVTYIDSLSCEAPANLGDYVVDGQQLADLLSAIVLLLLVAYTVKIVHKTITGRR